MKRTIEHSYFFYFGGKINIKSNFLFVLELKKLIDHKFNNRFNHQKVPFIVYDFVLSIFFFFNSVPFPEKKNSKTKQEQQKMK